MSATCPECGWNGPATEVVGGGLCPRCPTAVRVSYDGKPLNGSAIRNVGDFNERALKALATCATTGWDEGFLASVRYAIQHRGPLSEGQQNNLTRMVLRHSRDVADRPVVDYAVMHAPRETA